MSKKMMLLALALASAALFALPTFASAEEIHFDTATTFAGDGGASSLVATGEPTVTCASTDVNDGSISAGGTTGTMTLDSTGCHLIVLGVTGHCRTKGSITTNTISSGETFHLITIKTSVPGVLVTFNTTEIECDNPLSPPNPVFIHVEGNLIGTITSPACNAESKEMKLSFSTTGSTQNHLEYTGKKYDLLAKTGGGSQLTAGLNLSATVTMNAAGKLTCT
jgi:hypothetical protein